MSCQRIARSFLDSRASIVFVERNFMQANAELNQQAEIDLPDVGGEIAHASAI